MKDLAANRDALITQFREIGDKLLEKAHKDFLDKAGERFTEADKATPGQAAELAPAGRGDLKRYEEGLQRVEKERRRPLCRPARGGRAGPGGAGAGPRRDPQPGQCAALVAQGARPLGRAEPCATCSSRPGSAPCRFPHRGFGRYRRRAAASRRDRPPARRAEAGDRRQMLVQRLSRCLRGGR